MRSNNQQRLCGKCGFEATTAEDDTDYPYECLRCDEHLYGIETVMSNVPESRHCRQCGHKVYTLTENSNYQYGCEPCGNLLSELDTIDIAVIPTNRKEINCKTLEKRMSYYELKAFLATRPEYRLMHLSEFNQYRIYLPDELVFVSGLKLTNGIPYPRACSIMYGKMHDKYISPHFKLKVFLIRTGLDLEKLLFISQNDN